MAAVGLIPESFTPDDLGGLFAALDSKLGVRDDPVRLLVVGGAAIALRWNPERLTKDVDVVSDWLPTEVRAAVAAVALEREGVPPGWLNDAAFVSRPPGPMPEEPTVVYRGENLTVSVAGPRYVLAMKVFSRRWVDRRDLPVLLEAAGVGTRNELDVLVDEAYPELSLRPTARCFMDDAWAAYQAGASRDSPGPEAVQRHPGRDNPISVSVRPVPDSNSGWELVMRAPDGLPIEASAPYTTEDAAAAALDFATRVVNNYHPLRFEGWTPTWAMSRRVPYEPHARPPAGAVTVRVICPARGTTDLWRLAAARQDGEVVATSRSYPSYEAVDHARDFLAVLSGLAGNPAVQGRVKESTPEDDRACGCRDRG